MRRRLLLALVLLALGSGCASPHLPPVVVVVPPVVVPPLVVKPHTWTLLLEARDTDFFCVQTADPSRQPCWKVGYLRAEMVSLKAE